MSDDLEGMACAEWLAAISADVDGEDPGVDPRLLAAHLDSCPSCRRYRDEAATIRRTASVAAAATMPDLSARVSRLNAVADRAGRSWLVRALLGVVAVEIMVVSVPPLLGGGHHDSIHEARHLGAFSVAYAVALLLVVVRPARARAILPVTIVLAGALLITAVVDVAEGHVPLVNEAAHLPELLSVALVWVLSRPVPDRGPTTAGADRRLRSLRVLDDPDPDPDPARDREAG